MRSSLSVGSWMAQMIVVGLAVICFSGHLLEPVSASSAPSKRLRLFASMLSGHLTNEDQRQNEIDNGMSPRASHTATFTPVNVQLFQPSITLFFEETVGGDLVRRHIAVIEEGDEEMVIVRAFNVTRPLPDSPGSVDSSSLEDLSSDEIEYIDVCDPRYCEVEKGIFFGKWPECMVFTPESHIFYPGVMTCDVLTFLSLTSATDPDNGSQVPLQFRAEKRFKLLNGKGRKTKNLCSKRKG